MSKRRKKPRTSRNCAANNTDAPDSDLRLAPVADLKRILQKCSQPPPTLFEELDGKGPSWVSIKGLVHELGSVEAIDSLSIEPHCDPTFDWAGIPATDQKSIEQLLLLIEDSNINRFRDPEYETIMWRVTRALALDPARPLDRRTKPARKAAAIAWVALKANGQVGRRAATTTQDLWDAFGVGSCSALANDFAWSLLVKNLGPKEAGYCREMWWDEGSIPVASSELLHSRLRGRLLAQRERVLESIAARHADPGPVFPTTDGFAMKSRPTSVRWAYKGTSDEGRTMVSIALGELDDVELIAISVPDAHRLRDALDVALAASVKPI